MGLNTKGIPNIFPHSRETSTGGGSERIGQSTVIVSLDGTGDTDDIQSAIDMLPATGGSVFIKEGTYLIYTQISLKSNITIQGVGAGTILKFADGRSDMSMFFGSSDDNMNLVDFKIDGNSAGQAGTTDTSGIKLTACEKCRISNIKMTDLQGSGAGVWVLGVGAGGHIITECKISDSGCTAAIIITNDNCIISNNVIKNISIGSGISFTASGGTTITGNTIDNASFGGIACGDGVESVIIGNTSINNSGSGISMTSSRSRDWTITGNVCVDNSSDGISISNPDKCIVSSNQCQNNGAYGIDIGAGSDRTLIIGNVILNNTSGQLRDSGSNTTAANNIIA